MIINSPEEMLQLGTELAKDHKIILLEGELGAGKTLFTKGFAKGLGISDTVQSPTYTYLNIYDNKLLHIDMYRLTDPHDIISKGIHEEINNHEYIIIERPKFHEVLGLQNYTTITIDRVGENQRKVNIVQKLSS